MSKIRVQLNPLMTGRVGAFTYYERNKEQIVRQSRNNSNVGESASRSVAQQTQRTKWANAVNFWKLVAPYLRSSFQIKKSSQTDYNRFMQVNVSASPIYLTKQQAEGGQVIPYGYQISEGSFAPITKELVDADTLTGTILLALTAGEAINTGTTWGQFCTDLIENNPEWQNGDNFAVLAFESYVTVNNISKLRVRYIEQTVDTSSTTTMTASPVGRLIRVSAEEESQGEMTLLHPGMEGVRAGLVAIHTRRNGTLLVSSEHVQVPESLYRNYTTDAAIQAAIESYGLNQLVELDPN